MLEEAQNPYLKKWLNEIANLVKPKNIHICNGSEEEHRLLTEEALKTGELIELNQKKLPGCYYHRTDKNDVARTEHCTYICTKNRDDAGPTNNWMTTREARKIIKKLFDGAMSGRTMYVIPYSMGPIGSPYSKIGIEITDSIYVVLNMRIMTRMGTEALKQLGNSDNFNRGLHSIGDLNPENRYILHFPETNEIVSINSGYGGNVLLSKKCLSLRIASWLARKEGWLAEHMLIMGIENPQGKITYIAAAFPSACGKTNLAMMIPPKSMKGYKVWTIGDDIAWMRINKDGKLYAINPENGFFGVMPGTNSKTNPNAMKTISKNTIYTNVVLKPDLTVWWEGHDDPAPKKALDWQGRPYGSDSRDADNKPIKGAHPNSRFTAPINQCPCLSSEWENPEGVPISAIIFGGRRATTAPLVYQSRDWNHGVYIGATMASERTAAQYGKQGELRYDPMAMLPFCGYNMADYFQHWIDTGGRIKNPPKIFHVNWFRTDSAGKFLWPGFSENLRVLDWIINRCNNPENTANTIETPIGYIPAPDSLNLNGLNLSSDALRELLKIDPAEWRDEIISREKFFTQFGNDLPEEITEEQKKLDRRKRRLKKGNIYTQEKIMKEFGIL